MAGINRKFPTMDEFAKEVAEKALDEILYDNKSIREWMQIIGSEDAISRQAVIDKKELVELEDGQSFYCISPEAVETLPPITPQLKTGHWIDNNNGTISCNYCHTWFNKDNRYSYMHYCPNCKAKMAEGSNEE